HWGACGRPLFAYKCKHRSCSSKTHRDEDRRLSLRQLSVQYSEGREPSKFRTETERDRNHRGKEWHRRFHAQGGKTCFLCGAQGNAEKGWLHPRLRQDKGQWETRA